MTRTDVNVAYRRSWFHCIASHGGFLFSSSQSPQNFQISEIIINKSQKTREENKSPNLSSAKNTIQCEYKLDALCIAVFAFVDPKCFGVKNLSSRHSFTKVVLSCVRLTIMLLLYPYNFTSCKESKLDLLRRYAIDFVFCSLQERQYKDSMQQKLQKLFQAQGREAMIGSAENIREFTEWYFSGHDK